MWQKIAVIIFARNHSMTQHQQGSAWARHWHVLYVLLYTDIGTCCREPGTCVLHQVHREVDMWATSYKPTFCVEQKTVRAPKHAGQISPVPSIGFRAASHLILACARAPLWYPFAGHAQLLVNNKRVRDLTTCKYTYYAFRDGGPCAKDKNFPGFLHIRE